ncbi:hypothetical protein D3OALGA1CA_3284 [Olavius algarvensis associated proteobacterium Delta 3]|nr:hypothetical protein D3OALGB2SA_1794 [Olavius algarvensis associated proteobacterium Delta 3]CAB5131921.1 hypothetical protein D3OALGA1CA_3284 [Olavius algarvensis associated proteobacterium Delta 3]
MSYRNLEVWQLAEKMVIDVHRMTIEKLPKFEMFEGGSQIRRSSKSVKSAIVEGYGRRRYKQEFLKFLTYALGSNDETMDHLETLQKTGSLQDQKLFASLHDQIDLLGKKLNLFIRSVREQHVSEK